MFNTICITLKNLFNPADRLIFVSVAPPAVRVASRTSLMVFLAMLNDSLWGLGKLTIPHLRPPNNHPQAPCFGEVQATKGTPLGAFPRGWVTSLGLPRQPVVICYLFVHKKSFVIQTWLDNSTWRSRVLGVRVTTTNQLTMNKSQACKSTLGMCK